MSDRGVYLYRITLSKEGEDPLYYFGIRYAFQGKPEDDDYMGSPETYKSFWEDPSYTKTKKILKSGTFSNQEELQEYALLEIDMIKEAWDRYGSYTKGGRCLNAQAGRVFIHTEEIRKKISEWSSKYWTGNPNHPMKRPEVAAKQAKSMSKFLLENPDKNPNNLPGVKEKQRKATTENNPMHNPEIVAKISGENNGMYGKKHSEEKKRQISESVKQAHSNPEVKKKLSEASKRLWASEDGRKRMLEARKDSNQKRIETLKRNYKNNPELHEKRSKLSKEQFNKNPELREKMMGDKNVAKRPEVRKKISESLKKLYYEKRQQTNSLENYFD